MSEGRPESERGPSPTVALSTRLEEGFVAPLTAVRGALEILRDHPDLSDDERRRFVASALRGCARLETAIEHLAETVYTAGREAITDTGATAQSATSAFAGRIRFDEAARIVEIDFSNVRFGDSQTVNAFYDAIDAMIEQTRRRWYFLVDYRGCTVWPEAWVAFAHRGKKAQVGYSLGTVRYAEIDDPKERAAQFGAADPDFFESRQAAVARIEALKRSARN